MKETGKEPVTEKKNKGLIILQAICEICLPFIIIGSVFFLIVTNVLYSQSKKNNAIIDNLNVLDSQDEFENYLEAVTYNNDKIIIDLEEEGVFSTETKGRITDDGDPYDEHYYHIFGYRFRGDVDFDEEEIYEEIRQGNKDNINLWLIASSEIIYDEDNNEELTLNGYSLHEKNELFETGDLEIYQGDYPDYFEMNEEQFRKSHLLRVKILGILLVVIIAMYVINLILKPKLYPVDKLNLAEPKDK